MVRLEKAATNLTAVIKDSVIYKILLLLRTEGFILVSPFISAAARKYHGVL